MKPFSNLLSRLFTCSFLLASAASAAPFTPGNLVVHRTYNGGTALTSAAAGVFLDEYTPSGTYVQTIALPSTAAGSGNRAVCASGSASSEGDLSLSPDGLYLACTGYNAGVGTAGVASTTNNGGGGDVSRVIARIDSSGAVDSTTVLIGTAGTPLYTGNNFRSAIVSGTKVYHCGAAAPFCGYSAFQATTGTTIGASATTRAVRIFNGDVYYVGSGTCFKVSGLPTGSSTATSFTFSGTAPGSPGGFAFLDVGNTGSLNTAYFVDGTTLRKYSLSGTTLTAKGTTPLATGSSVGLATSVSGSTVNLFTTAVTSGVSSIQKTVDASGAGGTLSASASTLTLTGNPVSANFYFRGIALAPAAYTVTYDANNGTGSQTDGSSPYGAGATVTVLGAGSIVRAGYTFAGWNTAADGSGTGYSAGNTFSINANTTLFAQWSLIPLPVVTIAATDANAAEAPVADPGTFRITRSGSTSGDLTVSYTVATGAGRASAADYTPTLAGTATIPNGQSFVDITVTPVDDIQLEGDETLVLTLAGNAAYTLGANVSATVTITDNETAIDLSRYARVGRYALPHPTTTTPPSAFNLLCQEASSVTYNWDTDTLFIVGDGGTGVTQVTKTGAYIDSMTLAAGSSPQGTEFYDTEGITYIGGGQFVMTEERDRQLVKFTYAAGTTLNRAAAKTVKIGTTIGNIGIEGLCYDPQTSGATPGFLVVKEMSPKGIFQTNVDFTAGTATNGSASTVNSTDLFDPALLSVVDHSDVFSLANLPALSGKPASSHALIISQESGQVIHFDRSGVTYSTLTITKDAGDALSVAAMTMEGVTMDRSGVLYIVNENGGGDASHPQLWVYAPTTSINAAPTAIALASVTSSLPENTPTTSAVKLADISVTDDGTGSNTLSVSGADAASFEVVGTSLFLKAGTTLSHTTKPAYSISVNVDDTSVGSTPDASTAYTLTITAPVTSSSLIISEVAPWSSGNGAGLLADWFEVTNTGVTAVDITNWKMDDSNPSFATAVPLSGITSIAPGESVIFIETATPADLASKASAFRTLWFGANPPAGLQIGSYSGSGAGLSTGGDAVNLFNAGGITQAGVTFGTSPASAPFGTFDNAAGLNNTAVSTLSTVGVNGAFAAAGDANEIGSPGSASAGITPVINITAIDASASETAPDTGTFQFTRTGGTASALTVNYTISGSASSGDYTPALSGAVVIASGQSSATVVITPVDDATFEGSETLTLGITDTGSYDVGSNGSATVTIADNEVNNPPPAVALTNAVSYLSESASTASDVLIAGITVTDDGNGTNTLSLSGADAASFTISGSSLYLKSGTSLSFATKPAYAVTVNVDDSTVGTTPDASTSFTLNITKFITPGTIVITEISPWSSTAANSPLAADWFEVTNRSGSAVDITGWKVDDNSHALASALTLNGITSIAPGESVIFIESAAPATIVTTFKNLWFGANPPAGLQVGTYTGSGIGLGSTGDEVVLFDRSGLMVTGVAFGASPASAPFATFDNAANAGSSTLPFPTIATLSATGTNGAFVAVGDTNEIGSPGSTSTSTFAFASSTYTVNESAGAVTLTINRSGGVTPATITLNTADGTAVSGTDYTAQSNVIVSFAMNDTSKTVSVPVVNRSGIRASRTFSATISAPSAGSALGTPSTTAVTITEADTLAAMTGPSSSATPYIRALDPSFYITSLLTVGDSVGGYQMCGIPDGLGAFDNNDGTFTLLMHHELGSTAGSTRAHGAKGAFVSAWIINKTSLQVLSGSDLMQNVYGWNSGTQQSNATTSIIAFNRFCSADLPPVSAFYNAATGLGTQERLFMGGEEGGATGYALSHVATGANKGTSYILGKFNLTTNGSGLTGVGAWETLCANPFPQDKTVVMGNNDGGTGIMSNSVSVYQGTKTNTGTEADKAGLTNGTLKFVVVAGNTTEIANTTTRATNITNGTRFSLSANTSTTFSRPEDGAWNPLNPNQYYFVTTDQLDQVNDGLGTQIGRTRLWRLTFDDITNPDLGGVIDMLIEGGASTPVANDGNMFDNLTVSADGKLMLEEDVGNAAHNGKIWFFNPATNTLTKATKSDNNRFGDTAQAATSPFNVDEENSGIIDVTALLGGNALTGDRLFLNVTQAHYSLAAPLVEGGQLQLIRQSAPLSTPFLGVASGDADTSGVTLWTRYNNATAATINVQVSTNSAFTGTPTTVTSGAPSATNDWTSKVRVTGLTPGNAYFYRFYCPTTGEVSGTGSFKTAPATTSSSAVRFAFSGDMDGLMRPYPLASTLGAQGLDFYVNLGDTIYENASNAAGNNGASWLNSPSVTLSGSSASLNGVPTSTGFATAAQLKTDYEKKYREQFLPVNVGGQNALRDMYAAVGCYTTWDNHELGNRQYINGGAPAGGPIGGPAGTDMATGRGVDARNNGSGNVGNVNDVNTSASDYMNRSTGFQTLRDVFLEYMPVADRSPISAPSDPRTDGSKQLYTSNQWGRNAVHIMTDTRSYRDLRLKTANGGADDTTAPRANNPNRTMFGATQLAWLKAQLSAAQAAGVTWKFVSISDPIDQLGPIGGALSGTLTSVNSDGGKSFIGGYRAERNALLKWIADNRILNVVFLATDDHQNRINELTYSPTDSENQATYVKVPYCFSIVCGPLGATGPETITDHSFNNIKAIADSLANAQSAAGIEPVGLAGYPGLKNLVREGDGTAGASPQAADFYSPDTFNYTVLDVSADGRTLTVTSKGINSFAQNAALEYDATNNPVRTVFSFQVDALSPLDTARYVAYGTTANSGNTADASDSDGDGLPFLLEYALGTNPANGTNGVSALPVGISGSASDDPLLADRLYLSLLIPQTAPSDVTYVVQATNDIGAWTDVARKIGAGNWTWLGGGTARLLTSSQGPYQLVKVGDIVPRDTNNTRRFMRLKVTTP